jgi:exopolyphosphatase/pppGpp-phosphohydrolase
MERITAVIDVGSNTVRLLVARCGASTFVPTSTERVRLGLGRELEEHGRFSAETVAATTDAVRRLVSHARSHRARDCRTVRRRRRRAPLLLAASVILAEVQRRLVVPLVVSGGGVREGALMLAELRISRCVAQPLRLDRRSTTSTSRS